MAIARSTSAGPMNIITLNEKSEDDTRKIMQSLLEPPGQNLSKLKSLSTSMPDISRIGVADTETETEYDEEERRRSFKNEKKNGFMSKMFRFSGNQKHKKRRV